MAEERHHFIRQLSREEQRALWDKEIGEWTDDELVSMLMYRYQPSKIPPCCVCGKEMDCVGAGRGPTVYACTGQIPDPKNPGRWIWDPERQPADEHYSRSRFEDHRQGGDDQVIHLIGRFLGQRSDTRKLLMLGEVAEAARIFSEAEQRHADNQATARLMGGLRMPDASQCANEYFASAARLKETLAKLDAPSE